MAGVGCEEGGAGIGVLEEGGRVEATGRGERGEVYEFSWYGVGWGLG